VPFADTNIKRVLGRVFLGRPGTDKEAVALDAMAMPKRSSDLWHHALMDLGATICKPRGPLCEGCPLSAECRFARGHAGAAATAAVRHQDRSIRPAAYKDTDRRVRGAIVKALTQRDMTVRALEKQIGDERVGPLTEALVADGLIERSGRRFRLPL
jgi:A/G-specific adenine glycosylase